MTEQEWLGCAEPQKMLEFLRGKASDRRLRLTACGYSRSVWRFMSKASQAAVLLGEQMADESVSPRHREAVMRVAIDAVCRFDETIGDCFIAADMAYRIPCNDGWYAAEWTIGNWSHLAKGESIVRDIFGNPFRPVVVDAAWRASTVVSLATAIYDERAFDRLPILADALEDAGCDNADLLNHCRQPGDHVLGCWALDLLLGKQ